MNELFVNIKVDREERPDIDRIYQIAQQVLTQRSGGWPLTMFLTPRRPAALLRRHLFPERAAPRPAGVQGSAAARRGVLPRARSGPAQAERRADAGVRRTRATARLRRTAAQRRAARRAAGSSSPRTFDARFGGFGGAPKFPHPKTIERLLRDWYATRREAGAGPAGAVHGDAHAAPHGRRRPLRPARRRLLPLLRRCVLDDPALREDAVRQRRAARGVCAKRRSPPATRSIPQRRRRDRRLGDARDAVAGRRLLLEPRCGLRRPRRQVLRLGSRGSARRADAAGVRGVRAALRPRPRAELRGQAWHLHVFQPLESARDARSAACDCSTRARSCSAIRNRRIWPGRDEKILTSLERADDPRPGRRGARAASARTSRPPRRARSISSARRCGSDGRLLATYKDGRAHLNAYLDDYAYLADAILELQQVRFRSDELAFARELLDAMLARFEDAASGGFFFTSNDHEALIHRTQVVRRRRDPRRQRHRGVRPAAHGASARRDALSAGRRANAARRLAARSRNIRTRTRACSRHWKKSWQPPQIVILRGESGQIADWRRALSRLYSPHRVTLAIPADAD